MPILIRYLFFFAVMAGVSTAYASDLSSRQIREARQSGEIKSLRWVLEQIQSQSGGQVLDVELRKSKYKHNDRYIYKIKLLAEDGHINQLYVDANTAEVLRVKSRNQKRRSHKGKE